MSEPNRAAYMPGYFRALAVDYDGTLRAALAQPRDQHFDTPGFRADPMASQLLCARGTMQPHNDRPAVVPGDDSPSASSFELLRRCGEGASADIYEAEQLASGRRVALKRLKPGASRAARARFRAEAALLAELRSEHVVRLHEDHSDEGFFTMELLEGESLERAGRQPLPPARVVQIMRQLAQALAAVHSHGFVHCDIKPENVFLSTDATVKLLDFGIARRTTARAMGSDWSGTPLYMSPEQAFGRLAELDATSDVWAFAQLTYRLLSGQPYYPSEPAQRTLLRIAFDPMGAPSAVGCQISASFDAWFLRSCERDPRLRFRSVVEQADSLAEILDGAEVQLDLRPSRPSQICDGEPHVAPHAARRGQAYAWVAAASSCLLSLYALWS